MNYRSDSFYNLCRLCANYDAVKLEIFGDEGKGRSLVEKIQTCLPFQVSKNDHLPKSLCYRCMYNLENFYDFRMGCVNAVAMLESCLEPDGGKNLDKHYAEKRAKIVEQMLKQASQDSDKCMPLLEPQVPLPEKTEPISDETKDDSNCETSFSAPNLSSIKENSDFEDATEAEADMTEDDDEKIIDIDPADYLESSVSIGQDEDSDQSNSQTFKMKTRQREATKTASKGNVGKCELYTCKTCGKAFSSKGHLSLHVRIHKRENTHSTPTSGNRRSSVQTFCRPYRCDLCNKSYSSSKHLWGHVSSSHRGDPSVTCPECHRLFSSVFNLEEHKRSKHAEVFADGLSDEVDKTGVTTTSTDNAESNAETESGPAKGNACNNLKRKHEEDSSKFNDIPSVQVEEVAQNRRKNSKPRKIAHMDNYDSTDNDLEHVQCTLCPQKFLNEDDLVQHAMQHQPNIQDPNQVDSEDQSYSCLLCEKRFVSKLFLSNHLENQHGIDPVQIEGEKNNLERSNSIPSLVEVEVDLGTNTEDEEENTEDDSTNHILAESLLESETVFCCESCIREFNDRSSLWLHMLYTHKEAAASACGLCLKVCGDLDRLSQHLQDTHTASQMLVEKRRYSCTVCMRQHDSRKKLLSHVLIHDVQSTPEDLIILNSDLLQVDIDPENECEEDEIPDSFAANIASQNAQLGPATSTSPFACQICLKIFPNEEKMVKHKQNAHRQDALVHATTGVGTYHLFFRCEICGLSHQSKTERWRHIYEQHKDDPSVTCSKPGCGKVFTSSELAQEHLNHHVSQGATPNTCEICGKLWRSRVDYWKHMMGVHSEVVPDTCGVCLKVLPDLVQLMNHVKENHWPLTGGDYCCDVCGRPYSNKSKMCRHRKIHFSLPKRAVSEYSLPPPAPVQKKTKKDSAKSADVNKDKKAIVEAFRCEGCPDLVFDSREDFVLHRNANHGLMTCDLCDKFYGRTSHLWKHVNRVHKGNPTVTCGYCGKVSASRQHLKTHVLKTHKSTLKGASSSKSVKSKQKKLPSESLTCPRCSKGFRNRTLLLRHASSCAEEPPEIEPPETKELSQGPVACQECAKVFDSVNSLRKHERLAHTTYSCEVCHSRGLPSKTDLMEHILVAHKGSQALTCSVDGCGIVLRCSADREKHEAQHRNFTAAPPTCQLCGDLYTNRIKLRKHMAVHNKTSANTKCGVCFVSLQNFEDLQAHVIREHANVLENPNTCGACGKACGTHKQTFAHVSRFHGDYVKPCEECLGIFSSEEELKDHIQAVHGGAGSDSGNNGEAEDNADIKLEQDDCSVNGIDSFAYPCKVCSETFKTSEDLSQHLASNHAPEPVDLRKVECKVCSEVFLTEEALINHQQNSHNKEFQAYLGGRSRRSYKCNMCKELFSMPSLLMQHQKLRHRSEAQLLECSLCSKTFSNKVVYSKHVALCKQENVSILQQTLESGKTFAEEETREIPDMSNLAVYNGHFLDDANNVSGSKTTAKSTKSNRKVYDGNEGPIHCRLCDKVWPALKHQWQHLIRTHREAAATTCGICLEICTDYPSLSAHLARVHPHYLDGEGSNFTCRICGRYHNARSKLETHNSIHLEKTKELSENPSQHKCDACSEGFSTEEDLQNHVVKHTSKRPVTSKRPLSVKNETTISYDDEGEYCLSTNLSQKKLIGNDSNAPSETKKRKHESSLDAQQDPKDETDSKNINEHKITGFEESQQQNQI